MAIKLLFLMTALVTFSMPASAIEKPEHTVVDQIDEVEIREYGASVIAEVRVTGDFQSAGNQAFRYLGGYISGKNAASQKISMTAPVTQTAQGANQYVIAFFMPAKYSAEELPDPGTDRVKIRAVPTTLYAAIRYNGSWSEKNYAKNLASLQDTLAGNTSYQPSGEPVWARYDPPFMPGFLKTNEILIPVTRTTL